MALLLVALYPLLVFVSCLVHGFVVRTLWGWFFVPLLHLPALSLPGALGVSLVVSHFTTPMPHKEDDTGELAIVGLIVKPGLFLLLGWIVQAYI